MTAAKQPTLFDREQPRSLEVAGPELAALLADLESRGATVLNMTAIDTGRWLLLLDWQARHPVMVRRPGPPGPVRSLPAGKF